MLGCVGKNVAIRPDFAAEVTFDGSNVTTAAG
jgi:hypothetical protein